MPEDQNAPKPSGANPEPVNKWQGQADEATNTRAQNGGEPDVGAPNDNEFDDDMSDPEMDPVIDEEDVPDEDQADPEAEEGDDRDNRNAESDPRADLDEQRAT